jgi:hypothetical protein
VFLLVDCWLAGKIGMRYGDRYSISAQCYRSNCRLCRWLGALLGVLQKDHFRIAADLEDLRD